MGLRKKGRFQDEFGGICGVIPGGTSGLQSDKKYHASGDCLLLNFRKNRDIIIPDFVLWGGAMVLKLFSNEQAALAETKSLLQTKFPVEEFIVFGSVARGEATEESDLDLLVLTSCPMSHREKHAMSDLVFEVNLSHDARISILVVDKATWETGLLSVLPLHEEVARDGVAI